MTKVDVSMIKFDISLIKITFYDQSGHIYIYHGTKMVIFVPRVIILTLQSDNKKLGNNIWKYLIYRNCYHKDMQFFSSTENDEKEEKEMRADCRHSREEQMEERNGNDIQVGFLFFIFLQREV